MTEEEIDKHNKTMLIAAALTLGFEDLGDDVYKCTKSQLVSLICLCVRSSLDGTLYE